MLFARLTHGDVSAAAYDVLPFGGEDEAHEGGDGGGVLGVVIIIEGADDGVGLADGVLQRGLGKVPPVVGDGQRLDAGRDVGQADVADGALRLADGLDDGARGGHGEAAGHVVLVAQDAFLEELVGAGGRLAGVDHDAPVLAPDFAPVGDFAPEDAFQLRPGQPADGVRRVDHHGQGVIGDDGLRQVFAGGLGLHLLAELDGARGHGDVRRPVQQGRDAHAAAPAGDGDAGAGVEGHEAFGSLLGDGQHRVAPFDALGVQGGGQGGHGEGQQ